MKCIIFWKIFTFFIVFLFFNFSNSTVSSSDVNKLYNKKLFNITEKTAIESLNISNNKSIINPKSPSLYLGRFIIGIVRGNIDHWEKLDDCIEVFPIDVTITGIYTDREMSYFKFMTYRVPPDYGYDWSFVIKNFWGKLDNNIIKGFAFLILIIGFDDETNIPNFNFLN